MVWMNANNANAGFSSGNGNQAPMIIDENSITYYNQPSTTSLVEDVTQQPTSILNNMDLNSQMQQFSNQLGDYTSTGGTTTIPTADLFALQQQQLQLQQLNLAYGNFVNANMGTLMAANADEEEEQELSNEENEYEETSNDFAIQQQTQQQQLYFLQQQQQLLEQQNNIQLNESNYFLINNPHLYNNGSNGQEDMQPAQIRQQIIMPSNKLAVQQDMNFTMKSGGSTKKVKDSHKILPVRRPGLKLKTPIAYFGNTDPSVIPIQKDGMGVCEKCGAIGVKHAFYTKERRFCSLSCARGFEEIDQAKPKKVTNTSYKFKLDIKNEQDEEKASLFDNVMPQEPIPQIVRSLPHCPLDDRSTSVRRKPTEFLNSYDWNVQITKNHFYAAPVTCFSHAPGFDVWPDIEEGMKVEVENTDYKEQHDSHGLTTPFWIATVLKIHGYKALLRYEGYGDDACDHDFWVNLCTSEVHPVGWCAIQNKNIIPPLKIEGRIKNIRKYLIKSLNHAKTLPGSFYAKLYESFKSRFEQGLVLEVVDKNCISQVKLARISKIVGKRLFVQYFDGTGDDSGFWCHEDSPLIHPVGWATTVGHKLSAPPDYIERMNVAREQILDPNEDDATMDLFKLNFLYEDYFLDDKVTGFKEGMKLEAIDPLNLSSICVATVMEVLKFGYIMIRIDSYDPDMTGADWFCYHEKSPCIFPVGFCRSNNIPLTAPKGYNSHNFQWNIYLRDTKSVAATEEVFHNFPTNHHGFKISMKVECADLMDPRLVCVGTVSKVVGRLLKIHFDGWEDEYDQWLDCDSPDIYPVGWCVTVGHKLEGPRVQLTASSKLQTIKNVSPKNASKKNTKKGAKRKGVKAEVAERTPAPVYKKYSVQQPTASSSSSSPLQMKFIAKPSHQYPSQQQQRLKSEPAENSIISNISNFKNMQRNLELIEQQHVSQAYQQSESESEQESDEGPELLGGGLDDDDDIILSPYEWDCNDVIEFLSKNNCGQHCELFMKHKVDGKKLLDLTQNDIIQLLGMKVGPAIKIFDLIQQIKCKVTPVSSGQAPGAMGKMF